MPIDRIAVRGVRGIKEEITLDLAGRSFLLHGDNGTGKSSVERALRWALVGEEEPTPDPPYSTEESFRRNVSVSIDYPKVEVVFTDGSSITVVPDAVSTTKNGEALREACRQGWPFLRRSELLDVLSSRPVDRFQYFESFLGLDQADKTIDDLGTLKAANESRKTQLGSRMSSSIEPLAAFLPHGEPRPASVNDIEKAALRWARQLNLANAEDSIESTSARVREAAAASASGESLRLRAGLERLVQEARQLSSSLAQSGPVQLDALIAQQAGLLEQTVGAADAELIQHALVHFRRFEGEICPVCQQPVDWASAKDALEKRAAALDQFRHVTRDLDGAVSEARSRFERVDALAGRLAETLGQKGEPLAALSKTTAGILALRTALWNDRDARLTHIVSAGAGMLNEYFLSSAEEIEGQALAEIERLPTPEQIPQVHSLAALIARCASVVPQIMLLELEHGSLSKEVALQTLVLDAFRRARQDVARDTLTAIQDIVAENYFTIHPRGGRDDVTGAPSIDVQRHGKGTAFVRGEFGGQQVKNPQWVYSDGHLDTVGICIFLGLRRHRAKMPNDPKIMVLDDIVISIDLGHARRLIELLKLRFADHQILILTHNGLFAHWCKSLFPGLRRVQIKGWTLESGPRIGEYRHVRDKIDAAIRDGTAKDIAVALMELLDEWTAEARYAFSVAVAAKPNEEYTLTEIWEPLAAKLRKIAKALGSDLGGATAHLDKLTDIPAVRNQIGAHENDFAKEYPRSVMVEIAEAARALVDALYCSQCEAFVTPIPHHNRPSMLHCPDHHKQYVLTRDS